MKQMSFLEYVAARDERDIRLIDVRETHEWEAVHAIGAELHPLSAIQGGQLPEPDGRETCIICRSGARSATVTRLLASRGWSEVSNISDGTSGAIAAGEQYLKRV